MDNNLENHKIGFWMRYPKLTMILSYNIVTLFVLAIFYPLVPLLLGYEPGFIDVTKAVGASYPLQFIFVGIVCVIFGTIFFIITFKGIDHWWKLDSEIEKDAQELKEIRKKSINLPNLIFILQLSVVNVPMIVIGIIIPPITHVPLILAVKVITILFSLFTLAAVISHLIAKRVFKFILIHTFHGEGAEGSRIGITSKIFLLIIPMFIVAILLTVTLGYTKLIDEKGNMVYYICKIALNNKASVIKDFKDTAGIFKTMDGIDLKETKITPFIINPNGKVITSDNSILSSHFLYYIKQPVYGDRIFGDNNEVQGVVTKINTETGNYLLGYKFELASSQTVNYLLANFLILLLVNIIVLYVLSRAFSNDISMVAKSLEEIVQDEDVNLDKKIPITSNDEIADLVAAFNKILDKEKNHLKNIEENHEVLIEQERLASLGQMMGGIAHNMRTPIMSLSGAIEGLKDLAVEYNDSISDPEVTKEDHLEIAKEMLEWIEKMKPHCSYMSDIITAIKGQTLNTSLEQFNNFTLYDLSKRVDILMSHELKKYHCNLKMDFDADMSIPIKGDLSILVQILNNLILNAIEAYEDHGGDIDLKVKVEDKKVVLSVKDYAKGIPSSVKEKIFKEMITTKGKNGTGLGIYISYSNLKARFRGNMWFQSEDGKGTEFYISIPI